VNGDELRQRFLDNERMTFDELMALLAWAASEYDVADYAGNRERRQEMSKLSGAVRPACVRAQKHGTLSLEDRVRA
jgi:hypothetical protein